MINKIVKKTGVIGSLVAGLMLLTVGLIDAAEPPTCTPIDRGKATETYSKETTSICSDNIEGNAMDYMASGAGIFLVLGGFSSLGRKEDDDE